MAAPNNDPSGDTIYALSSGRPPAAIAVVRISGARAAETLTTLAGRIPAPRRATLSLLRDAGGDVLDRALVLWFPGPTSATGEDLAELHLHGGIAVVDAVLAELERSGLRLAEPGEFTRRALLTGRLDLDAVEGLADLLAAETQSQRREALLRAEGVLGRELRGWADRLVAISAQIEAEIDYDGEAEVATLPAVSTDLAKLTDDIAAALALPPAERLRDGLRVAIVGPVNAGKSSLFNALIGADAAIVSDRPGTTRDVIERPIALAGIPLLMLDTAGLRETADPIEQAGIERARQMMASADIRLDLSPDAQSAPGVIAVSTKIDIVAAPVGRVGVSTVTGEGLADLVREIGLMAATLLPGPGVVAFTRRYRVALQDLVSELRLTSTISDPLLRAEHVRHGLETLDGLIGGSDVTAVLDAVFSRFCLGK